MHRSPRLDPAAGRAWISSTDASGTELAVNGTTATTVRVERLPDAAGADAVRRGLDRILWQSLGAGGGEVYAVAHRRPRRVRVTVPTALGLLESGVPTVVHVEARA